MSQSPFTHNELQAAENIVRWQQYIFLLIQEGAAPELKEWAQGKLKAAITRLHAMDPEMDPQGANACDMPASSPSSPSMESPAANTSTQPSASDAPADAGANVTPTSPSTSKDGL